MDLVALFGTEVPPREGRRLQAGRASVTLEDGQLRHLRIDGVEAIRAVSFLVRDRDWGTAAPQIRDLVIEEGPDLCKVTYVADYAMGAGRLEARIMLTLTPDGLVAETEAVARGAVETNRAGFTVLHPIDGVAGAPVRVDHADGSTEETRFPDLIAPWQPFQDIATLTHQAGAWRVRCELVGDVFEMEDQRQWGDASFKTYNRPLALPWPYLLDDGAALTQAVRVTWQAAAPAALVAAIRARVSEPLFPDTALVLTPADARRAAARPDDLRSIGPQRILCHLDCATGPLRPQLDAFALLQRALPALAYDLELIALCPLQGDLDAEFQAYASDLGASGLGAASVMVTPSVDRQSTPPGSDWPPCPPLEAILDAARRAFPGVPLGGGVASFFPELNRKRPPVDRLDFVTHGLCPIVHAADDLSVMEALEAVPHILASARAIIGSAEYRLGPSTIAMRQNPYGSRTIPNPARVRICMADEDPRQDGAFAAAWTLGLAAAVAEAGLAVWTPAALYGPRGLFRDDGTVRPLAAVVTALAARAGARVGTARTDGTCALLGFAEDGFIANLTAIDQSPDLRPYGWRQLSAKDLRLAPAPHRC